MENFICHINKFRRFCNTSCTGSRIKLNLVRCETKMSGWQIHNYGEISELQYSKRLKIPVIRTSTQCLVRVLATSVNPIDVLMLRGYGAQILKVLRGQPNEIEFPLTLGREFSGILVQKGMNAKSNLDLGVRVWGVVPLHLNGAHAEYVTVPDYCLAPAPNILNDVQAASVLFGGLTAWSGLYITGGLSSATTPMFCRGGGYNKRVLILGGSGSVGSLAIQILKAEQAYVIATCSKDAILLVKSLGADCIVDYDNLDAVKTLQNYGPYDTVLDCAGLGAQYVHKINLDFKQFVTFSSPLARNIDNSGFCLGLLKNIAEIAASNVEAANSGKGLIKWAFFTPAPKGIKLMSQLVTNKKLLPIVEKNFTFNDMRDAFTRVQTGHLRGKIVVSLN